MYIAPTSARSEMPKKRRYLYTHVSIYLSTYLSRMMSISISIYIHIKQ